MLLFSSYFPIGLNVRYFWSIFFLAGWVRADSPDRAALEALIVGGELSRAEYLAEELPRESARRHYRGMIKFVKGDYTGSLEELSWRNFTIEQYYPKICQLKMINLFKVGRIRQFQREVKSCFSELLPHAPDGLVWIRAIYNIVSAGSEVRDLFSLEGRGFEIWFKAGMYLQKDDLLERVFLQLNDPGQENPGLRELLALHHYRQRRYEKAFVEAQKLSVLNAHNMLGRMHWVGGNPVEAWKHFNKAVEFRSDSVNALEYLPRLAWVLNHWGEGTRFLTRLASVRELTIEENALLVAFHIRQGRFEAARKGLRLLERHFSGALPLEGLLMGSYVSLGLKDGEALMPHALRACLLSEGINCWILLQQMGREDFEELADRDELIFPGDEPDIERYRKEVDVVPLRGKDFYPFRGHRGDGSPGV